MAPDLAQMLSSVLEGKEGRQEGGPARSNPDPNNTRRWFFF